MRGVSKEEYLNGQVSMFRNPKLGSVFYRSRYIEKFGTGIARIKNAYEESLIKPEFKIFENSKWVELPLLKTVLCNLDEDERKILDAMVGKKLSRHQIQQLTNMSKFDALKVFSQP